MAKKLKVKIKYLDYHMGALTQDPVLHQICKDLGKDLGVPMSEESGGPGSLGENFLWENVIYSIAPEKKAEYLRGVLAGLKPGTWLLYFHLLTDSPEARAMAEGGSPDGGTLSDVWKHRSAELAAATDPGVRQIIQDRGIQLIGY